MTYQISYESRQIVRPLGKHERIPSFSTADLLLRRTHNPLSLNEIRIRNSHERFAPHIETIKTLRGNGVTIRDISIKIGINANAIGTYIHRNREKFIC